MQIRRVKYQEGTTYKACEKGNRIAENVGAFYVKACPVITNQKMNQYIKKAAQIAGIDNLV